MSAGQYFEPTPQVPSRPTSVTLALADMTLALATDRGVFAASAIDAGTRLLLLDAPAPPTDGHVLDLGCGYGPIACTLARRAPAATVWALDVNERALALCAANAKANEIGNVRAVLADEVPADVRFAAIWSNPPIRIGKAALHTLLTTWLARLTPDGCAVLVVQRHLGADSLAVWLCTQGYAVDRIASRQGYRLLLVRPAATR
jgi:16S rRNA (guanine1207-N2)-methyltransferase